MSILTRRWPRSALVGLIGLPLLLLCCVAYYLAFAADLDAYLPDRGLFQLALNSHDHFIYSSRVGASREELLVLELSNDNGIAMIYTLLARAFPFLVNEEFTLLALVFNCATLVVVYAVWAELCNAFKLGTMGKLAFFANLSVIYFAQLINKDMLTLLVFLLAVLWGMRGHHWRLLALLPVFALVRLQLVVFVLILLLLLRSRHPARLMVAMYVATSVAAAWLSVFASIIGFESLGAGFSLFLIDLNRRYLVGYLIFNPLRVAQYVLDALLSFFVFTPSGGIDTAKLLRWPQLILLIALWRPLSRLVTRFRASLGSSAKPLVVAVVAYLLTWLMNPTVNARYVMLITPILVLFALHERAQSRSVTA